MTQLANANLLDDSVANSSSLKNKRLSKTAKMAVNPNPKPKADNFEKVEVNNKEIETEDEYGTDEDYQEVRQIRNESYKRYEPNNSAKKSLDSAKDSKVANDEKILGMSKPLFYTILGVAVVIGGVWAYNKFIKKNKNKTITDAVKGGLDNVGNVMPNPPTGGIPN